MSRIHPLHVGALLLVILLFLSFKLSSAKSELLEAKESYSQIVALSSTLSGLKEVYDNKEKTKKTLKRVLEHPSFASLNQEMKKTGIQISAQMMDAELLNALMSKLLNGSYNISALKIKKLSPTNVSFSMEVSW